MTNGNAELQAYLAQLSDELTLLDPKDRSDELRECRQHLEAAIEEGLSRGLDEADAVNHALRKFGSPVDVGRALQLVHLSRHRLLVRYGLIVLFMAVVTYGVVTVFGDRSFAPLATWWSRLLIVIALHVPLAVSWIAVHFYRRHKARRTLASIRPGGTPILEKWRFTTFRVVSLILWSAIFGYSFTATGVAIVDPAFAGSGVLTTGLLLMFASVLAVTSTLLQSRRRAAPVPNSQTTSGTR